MFVYKLCLFYKFFMYLIEAHNIGYQPGRLVIYWYHIDFKKLILTHPNYKLPMRKYRVTWLPKLSGGILLPDAVLCYVVCRLTRVMD